MVVRVCVRARAGSVCAGCVLTHKAVPSNQLQSQLVCQHGGVAMGDVGEGPSVHKHWRTLQQ